MDSFNRIFVISILVCLLSKGINAARRIQGGFSTIKYTNETRPGFIARIAIEPQSDFKLTPVRRICGGTVIHYEYILSAAQCFQNFAYDDKRQEGVHNLVPKDVIAFLGSIFTGGGMPYNIQKIHNHPKYNDEDKHYDIALLKTDRITFNSDPNGQYRIFPVNLSLDDPSPKEYRDLRIYGWGVTEIGDAGGPLMSSDQQIAIISRSYTSSIACGYHPNIYTKVTADLHWVYEVSNQFLFSWVANKCTKDASGHGAVTCRIED